MKRLVIFAHYDKQNIVDPYVISYLEELKNYADDIIFVSDGDLVEKEKSKLRGLCFEIIAKKHGEYDFGSYRRGFELISDKYPQKFQEIDELLFVNDSCYQVGSFKEIFSDMEKKDNCDCWGLVDDYTSFHDDKKYYIGSFFTSFRKEIFKKKFFTDFMEETKNYKSREEVISKCEFGLSEVLIKNNKSLFAYFNMNRVARYIADNHLKIADDIYDIATKNSYLNKRGALYAIVNDVCNVHTYNYLHSNKFYVLLKMGFPLLKRRNIQYESLKGQKLMFLWKEVLLKLEVLNKSVCRIKDHLDRVKVKTKSRMIISTRFNYFLYCISTLKLLYVKKYIKNGKNITTYKFLFFKIKLSPSTSSVLDK